MSFAIITTLAIMYLMHWGVFWDASSDLAFYIPTEWWGLWELA